MQALHRSTLSILHSTYILLTSYLHPTYAGPAPVDSLDLRCSNATTTLVSVTTMLVSVTAMLVSVTAMLVIVSGF